MGIAHNVKMDIFFKMDFVIRQFQIVFNMMKLLINVFNVIQ
jgi:hypothetical protein